jgi:hypothetical protein
MQLRKKIEERAKELCELYMKVYFDCDDASVFVTNIEVGRSGRFRIMFTESDMEEILYLPPEYFWLTDDEVSVRMSMDNKIKNEELKQKRDTHSANR